MEEMKTRALLTAFREIAIAIISCIEDYLDTPLDKSVLAKRREKVRLNIANNSVRAKE